MNEEKTLMKYKPNFEQEVYNNIVMQDVHKEYEEFVYTVSHDLSAPLRHLKEFSRLLLESLGGRLSIEERQYADFIEKSLLRLEAMQQAILKLSRIKTRMGSYQIVDANIVVKSCIEALKNKNIHTDYLVSYDSLPTINIEQAHFKEVVIQLLDNACRYGYNSGQQKVSIKHFDTSAEVVFEVSDNGIGIDTQFCHSVFSIFRRLHNQDEYGGGIGAGLTISQKIIESWGGNIWIKSSAGEGTKVFFSVPKE